jgi:transcriptional regulator with XRE-family HTH domain
MSETPEIMDIRLGKAIRERRHALGLSQAAIAQAMGISFQQVQKYERGANRVSFSALIKIAAILRCGAADLVSAVEGMAADQSRSPKYPTEAARLVELFQRIRSPDLREAMLKLAEAVAAKPAGGGPD